MCILPDEFPYSNKEIGTPIIESTAFYPLPTIPYRHSRDLVAAATAVVYRYGFRSASRISLQTGQSLPLIDVLFCFVLHSKHLRYAHIEEDSAVHGQTADRRTDAHKAQRGDQQRGTDVFCVGA